MSTLTRALLLSFGLSSLVFAQPSIGGDWIGTVQDAAGEHEVMMTLTVVDDVLTGSIIEPAGTEYSIQQGSVISGNQLQFSTSELQGETRIVTQWVGTVNGSEIAFTRSTDNGQNGTQAFSVRRH